MKISSLYSLESQPNSHNLKISKKVLIQKGQVPHLTNLTQAVFPANELANEHTHQDMYEIFFVEKGTGEVKINGKIIQVQAGDCITVEPGDAHEIKNSSSENLTITYMGIEVN